MVGFKVIMKCSSVNEATLDEPTLPLHQLLPPPLQEPLNAAAGSPFKGCIHIHNFIAACSWFNLSLIKMSAAVNHVGSSVAADDPQQLQQQVIMLQQRVRILEGECKELDKARTAEKAQRERCERRKKCTCFLAI